MYQISEIAGEKMNPDSGELGGCREKQGPKQLLHWARECQTSYKMTLMEKLDNMQD